MDLYEYFENTSGIGVLSTADSGGRVDAAIYARPHILEDKMAAFIMLDRLTRHNLQSNPHAAYLFKEDGPGYKGVRLFLTRISEEEETDRLYALRRKRHASKDDPTKGPKFLVIFKIDKVLPLVGAGK